MPKPPGTGGSPCVSGKRIILPAYRKSVVLGEFSSHQAACLALPILLRMPSVLTLADVDEVRQARQRWTAYKLERRPDHEARQGQAKG